MIIYTSLYFKFYQECFFVFQTAWKHQPKAEPASANAQ